MTKTANTQDWATGGKWANIVCHSELTVAMTVIDSGYCIDAPEYIPTAQVFWDDLEGNIILIPRSQ